MGLRAVDMSSCNAKCRCSKGPNVGKLYNVEQPCPYGYDFIESRCDCPQPCDWCPDSTATDPEKREGRCARIGPKDAEGNLPGVSGFSVNVVGEADEYYGAGTLLSSGCGVAGQSEPRVQFLGRFGTFNSAEFGGCPANPDGSDRCRDYGLYYEPYLSPCTTTARNAAFMSSIVGLATGSYPVRSRVGEDPFYRDGAWQSLWIIDNNLTPSDEEFWIKRLLNSSANTTSGNFRGDVGYFLGEYRIEITCRYRGL